MEEFRLKKNELISSAHSLMIKALEQKEKYIPDEPLQMKITVQGGVGTSEEHDFLIENYQVDSIGWGSPFLLVPEATSVDGETRDLLAKSKKDDYYLSNISPLGVPFNTVKGTSNEILKHYKEAKNKFGSSCPKKLLALSKEYSPKGICTASKKYQDIKLKDLEALKSDITQKQFESKKREITDKACLCVGLVNSAYLENGIEIKGEKQGVVVCPGPNLAYFDKEVSLSEMVQHIYGNGNILPETDRPNMFINELKMYVDHLRNEILNFSAELNNSQIKKWKTFKSNLLEGIHYYEDLFEKTSFFSSQKEKIKKQLEDFKSSLQQIIIPELQK